jgi:hypothetical protein
MRFDIAFSVVIALVSGGILAASPQVIFNNNQKNILSGDWIKAEGFYFGVGDSVARTRQSTSQDFAKQKAIQDAKSMLVNRKALEGVAWPKNIKSGTVKVLSRVMSQMISVRSKVSDVETLCVDEIEKSKYRAVVFVAEKNLKNVPFVSFEEVKKILLDPHWLKANFKRFSQELYEFYITQKELPKELEGIDFKNWNSEQLDLFCGITRVVKNDVGMKDSYAKRESEAKILNNDKRDKEGDIRKNHESVTVINETIGF